MEADLLRREEEVYSMTSTTRCLSCGQWPAGGAAQHRHGPVAHGGSSSSVVSGTHASAHPHHHSSSHQDDAISTPSLMSQSAPGGSAAVTGDQIHSLVSGSGGLRPLLPQHSPMKPVRDPYNMAANANTRRRAATAEKIPEPLYRKAKMAAQIKEMVKVTNPSTAMYGYGPSNPLYVLDGMVAAAAAADGSNDDDMSVMSDGTGKSTITPYTRANTAAPRGSTIKGSTRLGNSNSNSNSSSTGGLHFNNLSGAPISTAANHNGGSRRSSSNSVVADYVVLPSINVSPTPAHPPATAGSFSSINDSFPTSPSGGGGDRGLEVAAQPAKLNSYY